MLGSDPASHRRGQTARARARLVVQQAKARLQASERLPKLLRQRLPSSAQLLRDHHGSSVPEAVEQLLMGGRGYDKPDAAGWRQKRSKNQRGRGGNQGGDQDSRSKLHDYNELPELKGRGTYVACKCRAWFWAYGITETGCTSCGKYLGNETLQVCVDAGAVITGFAGKNQTSDRRGVPGAHPGASGKSKGKGKPGKADAKTPADDIAGHTGAVPPKHPAAGRSVPWIRLGQSSEDPSPSLGDRGVTALELEKLIAEAQAKGLLSHEGTITVQAPTEPQPVPEVKEEAELSPEDREQATHKALRNAENRRVRARDKWKKSLDKNSAAEEAICEELLHAKERLAKLEVNQRAAQALAEEHAVQFQAVEAEYSILLKKYDQVRKTAIEGAKKAEPAKPPKALSKSKEEKLWNKLEVRLVESLKSKVTSEGDGAAEDQAIEGRVAEALLEAKCLIHSLRQESTSDSEREREPDQEMAFEEDLEPAAADHPQQQTQPRESCWSEGKDQVDTSSEEMLPDKEQGASQLGAESQPQPPEEPPIKQARTSASVRAAPY